MEIIDLHKLFEYQADLDAKIAENHNVTYKSTRVKRTLALFVELGELCNETRCFKYWSNKPSSEKEVVLEEYVDVLHFLLSLGLDYGTNEKKFALKRVQVDLPTQFLNCYSAFLEFAKIRDDKSYVEAFNAFIILGFSLGFTSKQIEDAYVKKLKINYLRQKNNY